MTCSWHLPQNNPMSYKVISEERNTASPAPEEVHMYRVARGTFTSYINAQSYSDSPTEQGFPDKATSYHGPFPNHTQGWHHLHHHHHQSINQSINTYQYLPNYLSNAIHIIQRIGQSWKSVCLASRSTLVQKLGPQQVIMSICKRASQELHSTYTADRSMPPMLWMKRHVTHAHTHKAIFGAHTSSFSHSRLPCLAMLPTCKRETAWAAGNIGIANASVRPASSWPVMPWLEP